MSNSSFLEFFPFFEGVSVQESQQKSQKLCPIGKILENPPSISIYLKAQTVLSQVIISIYNTVDSQYLRLCLLKLFKSNLILAGF